MIDINGDMILSYTRYLITFKNVINDTVNVFADIEGFPDPSQFFKSSRPDIIVQVGNILNIIELTICFETNIVKSREYKQLKYKDLRNDLINMELETKLFTVEISVIGFMSKDTTPFTSLLRNMNVNVARMLSKCSEVCCRSSYRMVEVSGG